MTVELVADPPACCHCAEEARLAQMQLAEDAMILRADVAGLRTRLTVETVITGMFAAVALSLAWEALKLARAPKLVHLVQAA